MGLHVGGDEVIVFFLRCMIFFSKDQFLLIWLFTCLMLYIVAALILVGRTMSMGGHSTTYVIAACKWTEMLRNLEAQCSINLKTLCFDGIQDSLELHDIIPGLFANRDDNSGTTDNLRSLLIENQIQDLLYVQANGNHPKVNILKKCQNIALH